MTRVFLSTSFSGKVDVKTGTIVPEFRRYVESILEGLRRSKIYVFAAVEDEGWMLTNGIPPEIGVKKDLSEVDAADAVVALVQDKPSAGLQFEIGYAVAKNKRVVLVRHEKDKLAFFNQGVVSGGLVTLVTYDNVSALINQLVLAINAPEG